jgi:hypothetical protein
VLLEEVEFVPGKRLYLAKPGSHYTGNAAHPGILGFWGAHWRCCGFGLRLRPSPVAGAGIGHVKAFNGIGEVTHEVAAAQLTISKDFKAKVFLPIQQALYVLIFKGVQTLPVKSRIAPGFQQGCGS